MGASAGRAQRRPSTRRFRRSPELPRVRGPVWPKDRGERGASSCSSTSRTPTFRTTGAARRFRRAGNGAGGDGVRWARRYGRDGWSRARREMNGPDGLLLDRYDRAIRHTDREIARLVDALAARGLLDDTLLVITSDHGDSVGQHPYFAANRARRLFFEHSLYVWEETQHVPLIVLAPGTPPGARYREVNVSHVDLKPTILAALGLAGAGEPGPGSDLATLPEEPRAVYFLTFGRGQPGLLSQTRLDFPRYIGLRRGTRKFFVDRERFRDAEEGSCFLFDLASDPDELLNLCGERPAEALQLRSILVDWYRHSTSERTPPGGARRPR
ncbi:MAG: sulfatase-like hydrolase/transferase [Thermoanaerobaculia bacterium]